MEGVHIEPLSDSFLNTRPLGADRYEYYLADINRQLATRPEVWGVGLWPDAEIERVARGIAELWVSYGDVKRAAFIPDDKLRIIDFADCEWGLVTSTLTGIEREFNCKIAVEELRCDSQMTFGDLARMVKEREGLNPYNSKTIEQKGIFAFFKEWICPVMKPITALVALVIGSLLLKSCGS